MSNLRNVSALALIASIGAHAAVAQDDNMFTRDRVVGAGERYQPEYSPEPMRVGAFLLRPQIQVALENNSNVYATPDNEESDFIARLSPSLDVTTDWSRHQVSANLTAGHSEYADLTNESRAEGRARLRGRLDVTKDLNFGVSGEALRKVEARGETGAVRGVVEPGEVSTISGGTFAEFRRDRVEASVNVTVADIDFKDLKVEADSPIDPDRDFRDNLKTNYIARAAYAISPDVSVYMRGEYQTRDHDAVTIDGESLDTSLWKAQAGVSFQLPNLIRGDVALGYLSEDADSDAFADKEKFAYDAELQWLPTELTTVTVSAASFMQELGTIQTPSALVNEVNLRVDHELRRNIILFGRTQFRDEEFEDDVQQIDFSQSYTQFGIGASYKMNKRAHFEVAIDRRERDSFVADGDFSQNIISAGFKLYP
ncbi:MAG: hypothetical protein CME88_06895 [Hirschia sp.]|nr:hypothetical protein [Hirschia sp.]MBF18088.1 hypothetical protein [Hirschia sp.]